MRKVKGRLISMPALDPERPLHEQLRDHIRTLIAVGSISPGARMPGQRILAHDLKLSRNTVTAAYEALVSEGVLEGRTGAGTYVAKGLDLRRAVARPRIAHVADPPPEAALHQGVPALDLFPIDVWRKLQERAWRRISARALGYGHLGGWSGLRYILAQRLAAVRGVHCGPEQVHIVPTTLAGVRLICSALQAEGRSAVVESPGFNRVAAAFRAGGVRVVPGSVDVFGMDVALALARAPDAALAYVTPSAQFPTGAALSPQRREILLNWARRSNAWVVEDDYDSDFVFDCEPPAPMAAGEGADRVIYIGTLNNVLFPSLQLAYVVVPDALVDRFLAARVTLDGSINIPSQMVAHDFIDAGHLAAHVRRCREVYGERRAVLRRRCVEMLSGELSLVEQPAGLHVTGWLREGLHDTGVRDRCAAQGIVVHAMTDCRVAEEDVRSGLYLGFAAYAPHAIEKAVAGIASILRSR